MKLLPSLFILLGSIAGSQAAVLVSGFSTNTNGALVGQNAPQGQTWTQLGATATNPLTLTNGTLALNNTGQDAYISLGTSTTNGTVYFGYNLTVTTPRTGDTISTFSANTTGLGGGGRFLVQANGGGYVLGGAVGTTPTYGTTVLNTNTEYRIVFAYSVAPGGSNDSLSIYVNPTNLINQGANTPYLTLTNLTGLTSVDYFQLIQNVSSSAPNSTVNGLSVATTFSEAAVPEPATGGAVLCGLGATLIFRRRRI